MTALLQSVGIDCQPVLVGTRPSPEVEDDFPNGDCFNHLIAFLPNVDDGVYCDPTLGAGCLADLPAEVCGQRGLVISESGSSRLVRLPDYDDDVSDLEVEVDLRPLSGGSLQAEVAAVVRQASAHATSRYFDLPDTNVVKNVVMAIAGNRVSDALALTDWNRQTLPCGAYELKAVLRDTSWTSLDAHDADIVWFGAGDDAIELPESKERTLPLSIDIPQSFTLVLRAHEVPGWRLASRHAPIKVSAPGFRGEVTVDSREKGADRWLEIRRVVHFSQREYSVEEFREVRDQYLSFRLACFQSIRYQRLSDDTRIAKLRAYCNEHPEDLAFSFNSAVQILGSDLGGDGEDGRQRRRQARELLGFALAGSDAGGMPFLIAAAISIADDRYREADSLLTVGLERAPRDPYLLGAAIGVKTELYEYQDAIDLTRRAQAIGGDVSLSYSLIQYHLTLGQDVRAKQELERLEIIANDVDKSRLVVSRIAGFVASFRLEDAVRELEAGRQNLDEEWFQALQMDIESDGRHWDKAVAIAQSLQNERPLDAMCNNNLAWYLVCAGRDLERAEYHARMSMAVSGDNAPSSNTLAVILMRQGRVDEARAMLQDLLTDDRPSSQLSNGYFLGLSHWMAGERDRALTYWRGLAGLADRSEFGRLVQETLAAVDTGGDPAWLYLWPETDRQ